MTNADATTVRAFKENRFFGRRKGKKLNPSREVLYEHFLPKVRLKPLRENERVAAADLFDIPVKSAWLEIGFGGGEHLAAQSEKHRDVGFIGAEVYLNGVTSLLAHLTGTEGVGNLDENVGLKEGRADNVRIYDEDARDLFAGLADASFERIYVLFPDPWPKRKHESRRFIGPKNIPVLARLLKKGGLLRVASDDMTYIRWALRHLLDCPEFKWTAQTSADWKNPPDDWEQTRYEQKALAKGKKPVYLTFERV